MPKIKHLSVTSCSYQGIMTQNIVVCTDEDELYELAGHAKTIDRTWHKLPPLPEPDTKETPSKKGGKSK